MWSFQCSQNTQYSFCHFSMRCINCVDVYERQRKARKKHRTVIYQVFVIFVYNAHFGRSFEQIECVCVRGMCIGCGDCDAFKLHFFLDCYCVLFACLCQCTMHIFTHYRMMMIRSDEHFYALGIGHDTLQKWKNALYSSFSFIAFVQSLLQHLF